MRLVEVFEDDLEGGTADATVIFGLDGTSYEIDLSTENASKLRDALRPYVEVARPVAAPRAKRRGTNRASGHESPAKVREWAKENGYTVNARGRIPAEVLAAYRAAGGGS